jgi:hypothetical protein
MERLLTTGLEARLPGLMPRSAPEKSFAEGVRGFMGVGHAASNNQNILGEDFHADDQCRRRLPDPRRG